MDNKTLVERLEAICPETMTAEWTGPLKSPAEDAAFLAGARAMKAAALRATTGEGECAGGVYHLLRSIRYNATHGSQDRPLHERLRLIEQDAVKAIAAMEAAPTPAEPLRDAGEVEALYVDDVLTITDVSKTLGEIAENFDGGEYAISDESRRILIDFAHGLPDEGLWSIVECYFAQKYRAGSVYGWMHEIEWKGERTERVFSKCKPKRLAGPWSITSQAIFPLYTHPTPAQPVTDAEAKAARKAAIDARKDVDRRVPVIAAIEERDKLVADAERLRRYYEVTQTGIAMSKMAAMDGDAAKTLERLNKMCDAIDAALAGRNGDEA